MNERRVDPKVYTKIYYLENCGGYDEYSKYGGRVLNSKLAEIAKHLGDVKNKSILDIGCGRGELVIWLAGKGAKRVTGIDYSANAIKLANNILKKEKSTVKNKTNFITMDAKDVAKLNVNFDIVVMTEILEHLYPEEQDIILEKIKKILNKNGIIYIHTSPNKLFFDIFYRYWSYPISELITKLWNKVFGRNYGRLTKYKNLRDKYHKVMHVNEPTYFSLSSLFKRHSFEGRIRTTNITVVKPSISIKDRIFNLLVYFYPISNLYPLNIIMGCDFNAILKIDDN